MLPFLALCPIAKPLEDNQAMQVIKTSMNRYLSQFAAFRDRSFSFQLFVIVLLTVVFSFTISCFWQMAKQTENDYSGIPASGITAGLGALKK